MGARNKLNVACVYSCLVLAAVAGGMASSWSVFWATLALLVGGSFLSGGIRPRRRSRI